MSGIFIARTFEVYNLRTCADVSISDEVYFIVGIFVK